MSDAAAVIRQLQEDLRDERSRYRQLSEQSGPAILRAHDARGDAEYAATKLRAERDAALLALWTLMSVTLIEANRADRNLRLYLSHGE